jgi:hypothetical protein
MTLSRDELRLLDGIETGLRAADPAFAAKLTLEAADSYRRRQVSVAATALTISQAHHGLDVLRPTRLAKHSD